MYIHISLFVIVVISLFAISSYIHTTSKHKSYCDRDIEEIIHSNISLRTKENCNRLIETRFRYLKDYYCFQMVHTAAGTIGILLSAVGMSGIGISCLPKWVSLMISFVSFVCVVAAIYLLPSERSREFHLAWERLNTATERILYLISNERMKKSKREKKIGVIIRHALPEASGELISLSR